MSTRDFFDQQAELGSESDDEDFNGEAGDDEGEGEGERPRKSNGAKYDDSSEEEEDDDDEEAAAKIREGFIADDDDDEDERAAARARRAERKKRKREERQEEDENLDEDDLDLIADNDPELAAARRAAKAASSAKKFKRLKRGRNEQETVAEAGDDFWSDVEDGPLRSAGLENEMDGFIEEDFPEDEAADERAKEDLEVARSVSKNILAIQEAAGLDEESLEDFRQAFGDGTDYDWALDLAAMEEDEAGWNQEQSKPMFELKDVFEPSELDRKFLSDKDGQIRASDEPERFQLARSPYKDVVLTDDQAQEEAIWIANLLWAEKRLGRDLYESFKQAVAKTLEFLNGDDLEVPFIFRHRKDYLIQEQRVPVENRQPGDPEYETTGVKLLLEKDLWEIFNLDLKFRAMVEKRSALRKTYESLQEVAAFRDQTFEDMITKAETVEELQDIQEYLHFQHSSRITDVNLTNGVNGSRVQKRPGASKLQFEKVRNSTIYGLVRAYGITADAFALNALRALGDESIASRQYAEDPAQLPEDMASSPDILDPPDFSSAGHSLRAAKQMFAEELVMSPRFRLVMRRKWYEAAIFDCVRTPKGLAKIDSQHPFYDLKYLRNQQIKDFLESPGMFLRMLKAEDEGLLDVRARLRDFDTFRKSLFRELESDNLSDIADAWNKERREALTMALERINALMVRGVKATMKSKCEDLVSSRCRESFYDRLDQAPFKPKGERPGTVPRVLALSNGGGLFGKEPIAYVYVEEDSRMLSSGYLTDLGLAVPEKGIPDGKDVKALEAVISEHPPDAIAISGWSTDTLKLYRQIQKIINEKGILGPTYQDDDDEDGSDRQDPAEVYIVNDEVARLYKDSERAAKEYPSLTSLGRYCIGLARFMQSPLLEYANLGDDITAINFDSDQQYLPRERLRNSLDTALIDVTNMVGVDVNEAMDNQYTQSLLQYVAGLGPRKQMALQKAIRINGNVLTSRRDLVGDAEAGKVQAAGARVYTNCASFLRILYDIDDDNRDADPLDNTRIHPQDYDIARKMAADALELDEEDIEQEITDHGDGAIVRKLIRDNKRSNVEDLILNEYAEQLWERFHQRKRSTLQMIRSELIDEFEELREKFEDNLRTDVIFTMFTGETRESLDEGMIVPMNIRKVGDDFIEGRLDCGIEANVEAGQISEDGRSAKQMFTPHTTVQAKVLRIDKRQMNAKLTVLEDELRRGYERRLEWLPEEWDDVQEAQDREAMKKKDTAVQRQQRVIKHPNFRPFNATQAEEYLGSQAIGEVVIRPSSKGLDHLVVTWKVAEGVYKHIDVLELDKENEFSLGRTLKVDGRYSYSDLDELIQSHVKAMSRKVDEMMNHERYQKGSKSETEGWLSTYLEANPGRSMYAFCINPKAPGYFHLCFKAHTNSPPNDWNVKIVPGAYELQKHQYPDMMSLCNGFKTLYKNALVSRAAGRL